MATPEPPSPSAVAFPGMVRSPSKEHNAHGHPYPIKTTSTAILSRSNSITERSKIPLVYTPSPSPNAKPLGRSQSRGGHGRSGSLSNITPPLPLPLPTKRRDSQGSVQQDIPPTPDPEAIAQLPDNPKDWSPSQLSVYLSSALRFKGNGSIPARVAKDVAAFALKERLTGRAFLRLTDENLTAMGVNQLWREALLSASRTLRKKVLKGRIWGFGSPTDAEFPDQTSVKPAKRRIPSTVEEEAAAAALPQTPPPTLGYGAGRVRGMVESLERSHSSTGSGGSDEDFENSTLTNERLETELKAAGLWINDEAEGEEDAGNISSASSSSDIEDHHSRNSSGSQPPAYTRNAPLDVPDEPSMEALLAQSTPARGKAHSRREGTFEEAPSWGAMVWEKDTDIVGGTAKKIVPLDAPRPIKPGVISGEAQPTILNIFGDVTDKQEPQPLAPEANDAHILLDAFRVRLEKMEERLKELELRDEEREKEMAALRENEKKRIAEEEQRKQQEAEQKLRIDLSPQPDPYAAIIDTDDDEPVDIAWPRPVRQPFTPGAVLTPLAIPGQRGPGFVKEPESVDKDTRKKDTTAPLHDDDDAPPKDSTTDLIPSELPGYVLFVGLGVCVVVARVLFRRMGGGRRG